MIDKFKQYGFIEQEIIDEKTLVAFQSIKVFAKKVDEQTLLLSNGGGGFSLYLQDRFLNFTIDVESKAVSSFEGDIIERKIKTKKLQLSNTIKNALLILNTDDNLVAGTGSYIEFNSDNICYDKNKCLLQIGNIDINKEVIHFLGNGFAQIQGGRLAGLFFSDIEL